MPVVNRTSEMNAADRMILRIRHFARGTYPEADGASRTGKQARNEPRRIPDSIFFTIFAQR